MGEFWAPDFEVFYAAGKQILKNPAELYYVPRFLYLPSFAIFFAFTFSLLPFHTSFYLFYIVNYIAGILAILEFNRILILMGLKKKAHRFLFLIIISNGYLLWIIFFFNHFKFIMFLILLFIIRREIKYRKEEKEKNIQYYILNYGLFVFLLGMAPYFIFLLFIYLFQQIKLKNIFKKESFKMFFILLFWFTVQNITFIFYPSQIFEFLKGFRRPVEETRGAYPLYMKDFIDISSSRMEDISYIFLGILIIITVILILNKNEYIEIKFGLFLLAYLFFGVFSHPPLISYICCSFVLFLFVPFIKQDLKGYEFIKKNSLILIGLISIMGISLFTNNFFYWVFFPDLNEQDFGIFDTYRLLGLHIIMLISILTIYVIKYKEIIIGKEELNKNTSKEKKEIKENQLYFRNIKYSLNKKRRLKD
ncbi:MAG: glycosyltransferase family 87 protein [Promethearchaeota archaeon]